MALHYGTANNECMENSFVRCIKEMKVEETCIYYHNSKCNI